MTHQIQKQKICVENISCIFPASEKLGGLYLGNIYGASNSAILQQYGIRAVISLAPQKKISYNVLQIPFFKKVDAHDDSNYQIRQDIQNCIKFIQKHRKVTNVFVHCYAGVSRSAAVVIGYLMKNYKLSLKTALEFSKMKRIVVKPNQGFLAQLRQYEIELSKEKNIKAQNNKQNRQINLGENREKRVYSANQHMFSYRNN